MKESGLGTPATRAAIIEVLLKRGYIERSGRSLEATEKGIRLIEVVHPEVKSPSMTGQWEAYLQRIHHGAAQLKPFLEGIEKYVTEVVGKVGREPSVQRIAAAGEKDDRRPPAALLPERPPPTGDGKTPAELLTSVFGFGSFRPNQEEVCLAAMRAEMFCWSCRRAPANRCAINCRGSHGVERRW